MSRLFLGKWWHWAILAASVAGLWLAGHEKLHVVHFNAFVLSLLAATALVLAVILAGTRSGEQVTRDRLVADAGPTPDAARPRPASPDSD